MFDTYDLPGYQLVARAPTLWDCNWLQVKENSMDPAHVAFLHTLPGSEGFTDDFKELAEWDWMETPVGMVYIDTRRLRGQGLGARRRLHSAQHPPVPAQPDPVALRNAINRPQATTWAVPLDDTHTMQIGYYRAPEGKDPQRGTVFGQDGNRPYEERQRVPGDWDAQVSIHDGMARHGLEHLASTDRGIIMMRNMIRRGIRAVRDGEDLDYRILTNGAAVPTYSHDRVVAGHRCGGDAGGGPAVAARGRARCGRGDGEERPGAGLMGLARKYAVIDPASGKIDRRIFSDQAIYDDEMEKIFGRAWLMIGHESLVPAPDDYFHTYMGEDPVILTRDGEGRLHALLNMCRHRGNRVVRCDDGNAKRFMCAYHGWTYRNDGTLEHVPGESEAYYDALDRASLGLIEARVETYAGIVFATWAKDAPSLEAYLGDARWYLDTVFNRRDGGMQALGPMKWLEPANWKTMVDNCSDNYHVPTSHLSSAAGPGPLPRPPAAVA